MSSIGAIHERMAELDGQLFAIELTFVLSANTEAIEHILKDCSVRVERYPHRSAPTYTIEGTIQSIEKFERLLENSKSVSNESFIKTRDEVSSHLRRLCFPIVAEIEEHIRAFLKRIIFYHLGYKWPEALLAKEERVGMETKRKRGKKSDTKACFDSLFDYMTFERLLDAMEYDLSSRSLEDPLTVGELLSLEEGEHSIAALREKLRDETRKKTVWSDYIMPQIRNPEEWTQIKNMLRHKVCVYRNAVMHHRAISRDAYEWLLNHRQQILDFFTLGDYFPFAVGDPDHKAPVRLNLPKAIDTLAPFETEFIISQALKSLQSSYYRVFKEQVDDIPLRMKFADSMLSHYLISYDDEEE